MKVDINLTQALQTFLEGEVEKIRNGNYFSLIVISLLIISYWIFKELRKSYLDSKNKDYTFMEESIRTHSAALFALNSYLENSITINDLNKALENLVLYSQPSTLAILAEWLIHSEEIYLKKLHSEIICELKDLKESQTFIYKKHDVESFSYDFIYSIRKSNIDTLFYPIAYTIFLLLVLFMIYLVTIRDINSPNKFDTLYSITLLIFLASLFLAFVNIDLLFHKKLKNNKSLIVATIIYVLLIILILLKLDFFAIPLLLYSIVYIVFTLKSLKK